MNVALQALSGSKHFYECAFKAKKITNNSVTKFKPWAYNCDCGI